MPVTPQPAPSLALVLSRVGEVLQVIVGKETKLSLGFGDGHRSDLSTTAPKVTWIPTIDSYEVGGEQHTGSNGQAGRVVAMRLAGCDAHIWGAALPQSREDFSVCELLVHQVVFSIKYIAKARDSIIQSGRWEDKGRAEIASYGRAYILSFQIRLPVNEYGQATTTVPALSQQILPANP